MFLKTYIFRDVLVTSGLIKPFQSSNTQRDQRMLSTGHHLYLFLLSVANNACGSFTISNFLHKLLSKFPKYFINENYFVNVIKPKIISLHSLIFKNFLARNCRKVFAPNVFSENSLSSSSILQSCQVFFFLRPPLFIKLYGASL